MNSLKDKLYTEDEAANELRTNKNTIRFWRQQGKLKSVKFGKHPLIKESELLRFLDENDECAKSKSIECVNIDLAKGRERSAYEER